MTIASWTALLVASGALVAFAVTSEGYPVHKAELNDGSVWITNQSMGALGRQNVPVAQIDGRVFGGLPYTATPSLDVLQDGATVLSFDRTARTLMPVDIARTEGLEAQTVAADGSLAYLGGGSLLSVDGGSGEFRATTVDVTTGVVSLGPLAADAKPLGRVGGGAVGAVGRDGTVYVASGEERVLATVRRTPDGLALAKPSSEQLASETAPALVGMTAVGDVPVLLDDQGNVATRTDELRNAGDGAALQQPGPASDEVLVATTEALLGLALDGGSRRVVADVGAQEAVVAPVMMPNGCLFGAWRAGETGTLATACGGAKARTATFRVKADAELVFRINRNQVILNDQKSGDAWSLTTSKPELISNWEAYRQELTTTQSDSAHQSEAKVNQPPQATDDTLGARDGRTTVLNVLDNDLIGSEGILSIVGVNGTNRDDVQVRIAPDRQTLLATVSEGVSGVVNFGYTIDDGAADGSSRDDGQVTLQVRGDDGSSTPVLRPSAPNPTFAVAAGGVLEFPVTGDWRDPEYGDPVMVQSLQASGDLAVSTTALGLVRVEPPTGSAGGLQTLSYMASTGGPAAAGQVQVNVIPAGTTTVPAQAQPDVASGEVGGPITIKPLDNDIPGADGSDAGARLELAGRVAPTGGLTVDTDLESGQVTITGANPGTYTLSYRAGFGAAPRADGQIRVDVLPATPEGDKPIAAPDTGSVHGVSPTVIDVLANDKDPRGRMLVVQNAAPSTADSQLEVAVIDGRWLRINATDTAMAPSSQSVTYTISNGVQSATASVNVIQRPALTGTANAPVAQTDHVTVRAGDTAAAPVLDNDATPSGDPVGLALDPWVEPLGELRVLPAVGKAYIAGRQVRYVAPPSVTGPTDVDVQYVVENTGDPSAATTIGTLKVHITPAPSATNPNLDPAPRTLEGRVVQGDVLTLKLPSVGVDPDGDSVAVAGVATAPKLGRILAHGANSLTYQAYPDATGTDSFSYVVTDRFGARASGSVRVGVVSAGAPQPPVAVNDTFIAAPGRVIDVDAVLNDLRTPGTQVRILPLDDEREGARLQDTGGPVSVTAPDDKKVRTVPYTISNGLAESRAAITVTGQKGYNNPPIAHDLYATPKADAGSVEVDVLAGVVDVDGPEDDLELDTVTGLVAGEGDQEVRMRGGTAVIPVRDVAQVLTYRVLDGDGAAAAAAIYVPARPRGAPYLKPGAKIELAPGSSSDVDLSELVEDPEGDPVVLTTVDALSASPEDRLGVDGKDSNTLSVTSTDSEGPGSVVFEVSDRESLTDPDASTAYISVPVQVGRTQPVLNCPETPLDVPEGGVSKTIDIAAVCHVWTEDPAQARDLDFTSSWKQKPVDVDLDATGAGVQIVAGKGAHRGDTGIVALGARGYDATGELLVRVIALPEPRMAPIRLDTEATKSISVDVDDYLNSPMPGANRVAKVMKVGQTGGPKVPASASGSTIEFAPGADVDGTMTYRIEVSDVGGSETSGRPVAAGEVTLAVVARPDTPTGLVAGQEMLANTVALDWQVPDNNGKRIDGYEVSYSGPSSGTFRCAGPPCRVTGLRNGNPYTFKVRAHNATVQNDGWSEWSNEAQATPDALTGPPLDPAVVHQRDNALTVRWAAPAPCDCSEIQKYRIAWPGGVMDVPAEARETTVDAPNGDTVTVKITALNLKGVQTNTGPSTSVDGMGAGKPPTPAAPTLAPTNRPGNATKAIGISWSPVGANGPGPVSYRVQRTGGGTTTLLCAWTTATTCFDEVANTGTVYTYQVQAKNAEADSPREVTAGDKALHISPYGAGRSIEASAPPNAPRITSAEPTGADGTARITFDVGASHGASNTVTCQRGSGGSCGTWTYATNGATGVAEVIGGFPNGASTSITLTACNGGQANLCATSNSMNVTTYGAIGNVSINATPDSPSIGDRTTDWTINVDPNGAPVNWQVRSSINGVVASGTSGNGAFSRSGTETLAYNTSVTYTVTVTDVNDGSDINRGGQKQASNGARTGVQASCSNTPSMCPPPPPPPGPTPYLTFTQGTGTCTNFRVCENLGPSYPVHVTGHNFAAPSSCTSIYRDFTLGNNTQEAAVLPAGYTVRVTCQNGASGSYTIQSR